jgi:hypothetical protein
MTLHPNLMLEGIFRDPDQNPNRDPNRQSLVQSDAGK